MAKIVDSLQAASQHAWLAILPRLNETFIALARELKPSRSRPRIALELGAVGA
jgi:hypothetical protein